ncbi:MAG TPA: helix-turn-helix domain-containing protein [Bacteroidota bacterium]|nr:helix-turn-helix domain-containing protein [Bacteroidota bacterium]
MAQFVEDKTIQSTLTGALTLKDAVHEFERNLIIEALKLNANDKQKVAQLLGISISSLYRKLMETPAGDENREAA